MMRLLILCIILFFITCNSVEASSPPLPDKKPRDLLCLAKNIFYEARGQSLEDQIMVANVTLNRVNHPSFPDTVCDVVYEPYQFSWTIGNKRKISSYFEDSIEFEAWRNILALSKTILSGKVSDLTNSATFFHDISVEPSWSKSFELVAYTDQNRFYYTEGR